MGNVFCFGTRKTVRVSLALEFFLIPENGLTSLLLIIVVIRL